jgi:hypothetical protein
MDSTRRLAVRLAHLEEMFVSVGHLVEGGSTSVGIVGKSGPSSACNERLLLRAPEAFSASTMVESFREIKESVDAAVPVDAENALTSGLQNRLANTGLV